MHKTDNYDKFQRSSTRIFSKPENEKRIFDEVENENDEDSIFSPGKSPNQILKKKHKKSASLFEDTFKPKLVTTNKCILIIN